MLPSTWRFEFTGYLWASSVAGSTGFGSLPTLPYYAPFAKLLEHFQGGIMSAFGEIGQQGGVLTVEAEALNPGNVKVLATTNLTVTLLADIAPTAVNDPWVGIVIPHELTHLVFGTATDNPYHQPPHWFNEGLAVYLSQGYVAGDRSSVHLSLRVGTKSFATTNRSAAEDDSGVPLFMPARK